MKTRTQQKGFTLIETMVAISVLVVALAAPLTLASQSLFTAIYAKDQVIASYLAQEAIELVRAKRDSNLLRIIDGEHTAQWLDGIPTNEYFGVDIKTSEIVGCGEDCRSTYLKYSDNFYTYEGTGKDTRFTREVMVTHPDGSGEAHVVATVRWATGAFKERSVTIDEFIYDWVPTP